jgi:hypothetical protein
MKIMKNNVIYTGAFIDIATLHKTIKVGNRLEKLIENPHVTFQFRPETAPTSLFGEKVCVKVVGYGNDGKNEGLKVEVFANNQMLSKMAKEILVPHITISVSADGKPVDTAKLTFHPIKPFFLEMTFGAFTSNGVILEHE